MKREVKYRLYSMPSPLAKDIGDELNSYFSLYAVCLYDDRIWKWPKALKDEDAVIIFMVSSYTYRVVTGKEYMDMCDFHNDMLDNDTEGFYL